MNCKNCNSETCTKNGFSMKGKQRYRCKDCGLNFTEGDNRKNPETAVKKALAVMLYALGKSSYRFIGKLLNVYASTVQRWLEQESAKLNEVGLTQFLKNHFLER